MIIMPRIPNNNCSVIIMIPVIMTVISPIIVIKNGSPWMPIRRIIPPMPRRNIRHV
jgi:hypothetical protein